MIEFVVYDADDVYQDQVVPNYVTSTLLTNETSFHELTFDSDNKAWDTLKPGSRMAVLWDGVEVSRGWYGGEDIRPDLYPRKLYVFDDWKDFRRLSAWPDPALAIASQAHEYKRYAGPTETVIKAVCGDLNSRLSMGWTIPATAGLGSTQRVEVRFDKLADILAPLAAADGLVWSLRDGVVDVKQGDLFPSVLTEESGVLGDYFATIREPTVTRPIVGGEGEGAARVLRQYTDSARETLWGFRAEQFVDSRLAAGITNLQPDGNAALAEGAAKIQVTSELIEQDWFTFGTGPNQYQLGDRLHIRIGDRIDTTEMIQKVTITGDPSEGVRVVPSIGDLATTTDTRLGRQVMRFAREARALGRR